MQTPSLRPAFAALLLLILSSAAAPAQSNDSPTNPVHWTAQWITHPTAPLKEPITLHFRKSLEFSVVPAHYIVHVSADNRFVLYVNGQRVGDGPARGDLAHWRYETFDLAQLLHPGANLLAATVWNFGIYAPVAQFTDRTAFLVQTENQGKPDARSSADTNESWQVEEEPGQTPRPKKPNEQYTYFASGPGETLRAADFDWNWNSAATSSGHWLPAAPAMRESPWESGAAPRGTTANIQWALVPDTLPPMAYTSEPAGHIVRTTLPNADSFPAKPVEIAAHTHAHLLLDRSELTTAYPQLHF